MNVKTATASCAQPAGPPPGDCTQDQYDALKAKVDTACHGGQRINCNGLRLRDIEQIIKNRDQHLACADARQDMNNTCFRGGDAGHRQALADALTGAKNCDDAYNRAMAYGRRFGYGGNSQPAPQPEQEREEQTPDTNPVLPPPVPNLPRLQQPSPTPQPSIGSGRSGGGGRGGGGGGGGGFSLRPGLGPFFRQPPAIFQ